MAKNPRGRTGNQKVRLKTARGRKTSSTRWLQRQLNDPYVAEARRLGYRSRAAFKLIELDDKYKFLKPAKRLVDLGSAPGGWSQVAIERMAHKSEIVAIDLQEMEPVQGVTFAQMDFMAMGADEELLAMLRGPVDVVLSDMANSSTGHKLTDHLRTMALVEAAHDFATRVLTPGGTFASKVLQGGTDSELLSALKRDFKTVRHVKPPSSRKESTEWYVLATGFRGLGDKS